MKIISADRTVRDVVLELPQATRVFEKLKIDYCCGGDRPLGEACATAGVEVENLAGRGWTTPSVGEWLA